MFTKKTVFRSTVELIFKEKKNLDRSLPNFAFGAYNFTAVGWGAISSFQYTVEDA